MPLISSRQLFIDFYLKSFLFCVELTTISIMIVILGQFLRYAWKYRKNGKRLKTKGGST